MFWHPLFRETRKSYNAQLKAACESALQEIKDNFGEVAGKEDTIDKPSYVINR